MYVCMYVCASVCACVFVYKSGCKGKLFSLQLSCIFIQCKGLFVSHFVFINKLNCRNVK